MTFDSSNMMMSKNKYRFPGKEILLSALSLVIIYVFAGFNSSTMNVNNSAEKIIGGNGETLQDEYNYDYYVSNDINLPFHALKTANHYSHKFILDFGDENIDNGREPAAIVSGLVSNQIVPEYNAGLNFIRQLILQTKSPTEKALRSDVLLI